MSKTEALRSGPAIPRTIVMKLDTPLPAKVEVLAPAPDAFTLPPAGVFAKETTALELGAVLDQQGVHTKLPRAEVEKLRFSELAAKDLPPLFALVCDALKKIDAGTSPDDESIRPVRKAVERLRNNLDLFASVYPPNQWKVVRKQVDKVYESLGGLKDLQNSGLESPSASLGWSEVPSATDAAVLKLHQELLPARQQKVTQAKDDLLSVADAVKLLLENPTEKPKKVKQHSKNDSRFYWGGVEVKPKAKDTGLETIRRLLQGQVEVALATSKGVMKLDDPIGDAREKEFHDFRKRVRSLINVASYFPEVFKEPVKGVELQTKLYSLVYEYGEIEDRLVAARTAASLGAPDGRAAAEAEVKALWPQLVQWQKDEKINGLLEEYQAALGCAE